MKILHCADIHLGSILKSKFSKEISETRKSEVLATFGKMVDYAKNNDIKIIILSGDVFDKDKPALKDKDYFYGVISKNPDIDFLYLNGNHDKEGSYVNLDLENLKTFNKEDFTYYKYDNVVICGIEMDPINAKSFYSKLKLEKDNINIVMLHGEVSDSIGMDKIKIDNLKNKNIDYLALGHIHSYKLDKLGERGIYAYPGCLEPRGFDEVGEKGFIVLDIDKTIKTDFIPFSFRTIHEVSVDVSSASSLYDIVNLSKEKTKEINHKDIILLNLVGEVDSNIEFSEKDIESGLTDFFFVRVKNKTTLKIDFKKYEEDKTLIGEFIKGVNANNKYSLEEKNEIITLGLRALTGKEVK